MKRPRFFSFSSGLGPSDQRQSCHDVNNQPPIDAATAPPKLASYEEHARWSPTRSVKCGSIKKVHAVYIFASWLRIHGRFMNDDCVCSWSGAVLCFALTAFEHFEFLTCPVICSIVTGVSPVSSSGRYEEVAATHCCRSAVWNLP